MRLLVSVRMDRTPLTAFTSLSPLPRRGLRWPTALVCLVPLLASATHCAMGDTASIDFVSTPTKGAKKPPRPCVGHGECAPPTPYCDTASATCIECIADPNCSGPKKVCGPSGACVECVADPNCARAKAHCDIERFACAECLSDAHCEAPRICDLSERRCVPSCVDSSTCDPMKPYCDAGRRLCVECLTDLNCADTKKPACNAVGVCAECTIDQHCPAERPLCDANANKCVGATPTF